MLNADYENTGQPHNVAETGDWDTVSAITYAEMNNAITKNGTYPKQFEHSASDGSIRIKGRFSDWQMCTGGASELIHMSLTIPSAEISFDDEEFIKFNGYIEIELHANFIKQTDNHQVHELKINTSHSIAIVESKFDGLKRRDVGAASDMLKEWLQSNLDSFNHVFATVNYDVKFADSGIDWLKPSKIAYAVAEPMTNPTLDNSVFGVMCLVNDRKPTGPMQAQISINAIPEGQSAGFLISRHMLLRHIVLPGMSTLFKGATPKTISKYLQIGDAGLGASNKDKLTLVNFKLKNDAIDPIIDPSNFDLEMHATELHLTASNITFQIPLLGFIKDTLYASITYNARYQIRLHDDKSRLEIDLLHEQASTSVTKSKGFRIAMMAIDITALITSVLAAGAFVVGKVAGGVAEVAEGAAEVSEVAIGATETTALVTAEEIETGFVATSRAIAKGVIMGIEKLGLKFATVTRNVFLAAGAMGVISAIPKIQEAVAEDDFSEIPPLKDIIDKGLAKVIQFPVDLDGMELNTARLNGSLQLGIGPKQDEKD